MRPDPPPYVFVDIDGVLNAFTTSADMYESRTLEVPSDDGRLWRYPIQVRSRVLDWLRTSITRFDVQWATTWQDAANDVFGPAFELPPLPVAARTDAGFGIAPSHGLWKLIGVAETVGRDPRPFVWIDDEAIPDDADDLLAHLGVAHLCVRPDPMHGISDADLLEIGAFLRCNARTGGHA